MRRSHGQEGCHWSGAAWYVKTGRPWARRRGWRARGRVCSIRGRRRAHRADLVSPLWRHHRGGERTHHGIRLQDRGRGERHAIRVGTSVAAVSDTNTRSVGYVSAEIRVRRAKRRTMSGAYVRRWGDHKDLAREVLPPDSAPEEGRVAVRGPSWDCVRRAPVLECRLDARLAIRRVDMEPVSNARALCADELVACIGSTRRLRVRGRILIKEGTRKEARRGRAVCREAPLSARAGANRASMALPGHP